MSYMYKHYSDDQRLVMYFCVSVKNADLTIRAWNAFMCLFPFAKYIQNSVDDVHKDSSTDQPFKPQSWYSTATTSLEL